jgi:hypothetical protein
MALVNGSSKLFWVLVDNNNQLYSAFAKMLLQPKGIWPVIPTKYAEGHFLLPWWIATMAALTLTIIALPLSGLLIKAPL